MLGAAFISTVIGTKLPGKGALWVSQQMDFNCCRCGWATSSP